MSGALISYGIGYSANSTAATSVVIQPPPVYASGDLLVMGVIAGGTATTGGVVPSLPSGWTRLSASGATLATFYKTASGSESPYTVTVASTAASAGFVAAYPAASVVTSSFGHSSSNVTTFTGTFPGGVTSGETVLLVAGAVNNGTNAGYQNFNFPSATWTTDVPVFGPALPANPDGVQPVAIGLAEVTGSTGNPTLTSTEDCNLYGGFVVLNVTGKAPSPHQVTVTSQPPAGTVGIAVTVKALTGTQPAANILTQGATKSFYASGVSQAPAASITPNATGSVVYGAVTENFGVTGGNTFTANGSTTFSQNVADALSDAIYGTLKSGTTTASTPVTLGGSAPDNAYTVAALAEILASPGQAITEVATATVNAIYPGQYATTAASQTVVFTAAPPPGSLLVAMVSANSAYPAGNANVTITDTSGLTWTLLTQAQYPAYAGVFIAEVPGTAGPSGPVQAVIPQVFSKGRTTSSRNAPVHNPASGPVFRQATSPQRIRPSLPPRGRTSSNPGGPVNNPPPPPPVIADFSSTPGRAQPGAATPGTPSPGAAPTPGPVFQQATSPARIRPSLPPRGGRTASNPGGPVQNPPPVPPPGGHLSLSFSTGRTSWNLGGPIQNPTAGPVFYQATSPVMAKVPLHRPAGSASSTPPYIAPPVPPPPPVEWQFYGHVPVYYLDYLDGTTRETLYAVPGGSYVILIANTRAGLTIPPGDGRWIPGGSYDIPLRHKIALKLRAHIHKSRRRSGYRNPPEG